MANIDLSGFDVLDEILYKMEDPEKMAKGFISDAEETLLKSTKNAVKSALKDKSSTLPDSFVPTGTKTNQWGVYSVIRPVGYDEKGVSLADKALWLEYGRYRKGNAGRQGSLVENQIQAAAPWRQKAINDAYTEIERKLEKAIDEWLK